MTTVAYVNPFVPPEWIAAHGLRPRWLRPGGLDLQRIASLRRGTCPYAGTLLDAARAGTGTSALLLTTTCDQMRYAAALIEHEGDLPVFLMNVPSTWQTASSRRLYLEELKRLGRFLVSLGGIGPGEGHLAGVMEQYDRGRSELRAARGRWPARQLAEAVAALREGRPPALKEHGLPPSEKAVPLAIVGSPLAEADYAIFDFVEQAGGRVVLDGTESGERTVPRPFDPRRLRSDPLSELADAYFASIPAVFRRPNTGLFDWLEEEVRARGIRGILFRRYLWCDLWHVESHRLKERSLAPVLDIDVGDRDDGAMARTFGRIEAFLEMLEVITSSPPSVPQP
jgi:benzoyl-CoA reductase/2-hydroxyglutaryl-CoA dehydratase subunit BcrC/BadD/HgdB